MNTHIVQLNKYIAKNASGPLRLGTAGSHGNEYLQVTPGAGWEGLTIQVIFHPSQVACQLPADGLLEVPWEATAEELTVLQGRIVFQGFDADRLVNSTDLVYTVSGHSATTGRDEEPYTPGIVEGVLNQMDADKADILQAAHQAVLSKEAAAASAAEAADSAAKASETLARGQQTVKDAEIQALGNIAAAAPALPAVSMEAARQSVTVLPDGTSYTLAPMAPLEASICPTASGNPAVCSDSIAWNFQGLKVYGKSTQDGTPSPEKPVPIVNAGSSGSITLSVTDGAGQKQALILSTPSGLAGIPVDSGGNYTDPNGQQWICDVIDLENQVRTRNIGKGTNFAPRSIDQAAGAYFIRLDSYPEGIPKEKGYCMVSITSKKLASWDTMGPDAYYFTQNQNYDGVIIWPGESAAYSLEMVQKLIASNLEVYYELQNPITTPLSPEEVSAYRALATCSGSTVVSTDESVAGLKVRYVADGAKYAEKIQSMESRLAALEAAQAEI